MKKRLLLIFLALTLMLSLVACGDKGGNVDGEQSDTAGSQIVPADIVLFGGDDDYTIVYAGDATTGVKDLIVRMTEQVKAVTGENPKRVGDNSKKEKEVPKEILLASTNRAASSESMGKISGIGYRIEFVGDKLVVTASSDAVLKVAVEKLFDTWKTDGGRVVLSNTTVLSEDMSNSMMPLYENGAFKFKIVIQANASNAIHEAAEAMSGRIAGKVGSVVPVVYDTMSPAVDGEYEICIGKTNRQESIALYDTFENSYTYKVAVSGTRIVLLVRYPFG